MSVALQILLNDAEIDGKKTVYVSNRDIVCEYVPRKKAKTLSSDKVAVYLLIGTDENSNEDLIYIGETEGTATRLLDHDKKKEFWDSAFLFYSQSGNLNKADIKYLEAKIYQKVSDSTRYKTINSTKPKQSHVNQIREAELADIFKTIEFILGGAFNVFPFKCLNIEEGVSATQQEINRLQTEVQELEKEIFMMVGKGADAKGYLIGEGKKFAVLEGSFSAPIDKKANCFDDLSAANAIKVLLEQGRVTELNGRYFFNKTYIFNSPSGASDCISLGATNGWIEWKNKDGETLAKLR